MIIGVSGKSRAGKDTIGAHLQTLGFRRAAFADELKRVALEVDPYVLHDDPWQGGQWVRLHGLVTQVGWDEAKKSEDVRRFLQQLGSSVRTLDPDAWINSADLSGDVVVTDVRYRNEAERIHDAGGFVLRVNRPGSGLGVLAGHPSETELDDYPFDFTISNTGSIPELEAKVDYVLECTHKHHIV